MKRQRRRTRAKVKISARDKKNLVLVRTWWFRQYCRIIHDTSTTPDDEFKAIDSTLAKDLELSASTLRGLRNATRDLSTESMTKLREKLGDKLEGHPPEILSPQWSDYLAAWLERINVTRKPIARTANRSST